MATRDRLPAAIEQAVAKVGVIDTESPVTSEQIDNLGRLQDIQERAKHHRTIVQVWRRQQDQDRAMRRSYARWLMFVMYAEVVAVNAVFVLIGCGLLHYESWTADIFVTAVFAQVGGMALLVVKYLFPATSDRILDLIDRFKDGQRNS